jgi:hypothetical protein
MSEVRLTADSGGGYVELKAPSTTASNAAKTLVLPNDIGSAGQVLKNSSTAGTLEFGAGSPIQGWAQFEGSGNMTPAGSLNVASITDNGTGDYTINWDTDLTDDNYCFIGNAMEDHAGAENRGEQVCNPNRGSAAITGALSRFSTCNSASGNRTDSIEVYVAVVR